MEVNPILKALNKDLNLPNTPTSISPSVIRRFGLTTEANVLQLLPDSLQAAALALPADVAEMSEEELERISPPARHDRRVKMSFWDEYERAAREGRQVNTQSIVLGTGVSSWESYETSLTTKPERLSWFLTPPTQYKIALKEASQMSMKRLMDVLELPLIDAKGRPNVGVGMLVLQAVKFLDARLHGAITQKQVSVNVSATQPQDGVMDMGAIDARIAELEQQMAEKAVADAPPTMELDMAKEIIKDVTVEAEVVDGPY